jgi:hypothetical protein
MRALAVVGNVNVDLILGPVAPWPQPGTEVIVAHDDLRVGGAAGNTALVWQANGLAFQCAANIGADMFGDWLAAAFPHHAPHWPVSPRRTTLSVGVTHPDGERTFFTTDGHLRDMTAPGVLGALDGPSLRGGVLLLCGTFITDALATDYGDIFDWADSFGIAIALDTGWPPQGWTAPTRTQTLAWLARSQIALLNEVEATSLTQTTDVKAAAMALRQSMPRNALVVIKRGAAGALGIDATGQFHHVAAQPVQVLDTIGAGDIFNAGFLAADALGLPLPDCLRQGVDAATRAISTHPRQYRPIAPGLTA